MPKKPKPKTKKKPARKIPVNKLVISKKKRLPLIPTKAEVISAEFVDVLSDVFEKDEKLVSFYIAWIKNEGNSTKAYQELHPKTNENVAAVLGSRRLIKVKEKVGMNMLLCDFGLGLDLYLQKIKEGLNAVDSEYINVKIKTEKGKKPEIVYQKVETPNYAVQKSYHDKLGKLLMIEDNAPGVAVQVNTNIIDNIDDHELDDLIN